jgi:hypothetical protein
MTSSFYRVRQTHDTRNQLIRQLKPWKVMCGAHVRLARKLCGKRDIELLEGEWECAHCAKFDDLAARKLRAALQAPSYSHTSVRGYHREIGCVYHKDATSPTGVRASEVRFDPYCPAAISLITEETGPVLDGPQRGSFAGQGGW